MKKSSNLKSVQFLFQVSHVQNVNISQFDCDLTQKFEFLNFSLDSLS